MLREEIFAKAKENFDYMVKIRRELHKIPGVGFENFPTINFIKNELENIGINSDFCGKCALVADIGKGQTDKCILLRADTDALAINEQADLDFKSTNGNMHACGHDMHAAMLLGCAKILKEYEDRISGTVRLVFQSGEEILKGAADMIENGVLTNPVPSFAMMLHVMSALPLECGTIIVSSPGVSAPSADFFEIEIQGSACHGSAPVDGNDPVYTGAAIVTALSEINARELSMQDMAVLTVTSFVSGESANAIPDKAHLKGSFRTFDEELRIKIKERLVQICQGIAKVFRTTATVNFFSTCPSLLNDQVVSEKLYSYAKDMFGASVFTSEEFSKNSAKKGIQGSEDFAYISREIPSCMLAIVAGNSLDGYEYPLHHPKVRFDENALVKGAAIFAFTVITECGQS